MISTISTIFCVLYDKEKRYARIIGIRLIETEIEGTAKFSELSRGHEDERAAARTCHLLVV